MSPKNKKKLNIQRRKLDRLDNKLLTLIKIRTEIIKKKNLTSKKSINLERT